MKRLALLALLTALTPQAATSTPACKVDVQPKITLAPLRYLRMRVTIEVNPANDGATLWLTGPDGFVTSSEIHVGPDGPRTQQVEWKNIVEPVGEYEVELAVNGSGCHARDRMLAAGSLP